MKPLELILLLVVAGICGGVGRAISGNSRGGCLVSIAVGFVGALLGTWIARAMSLPPVFVLDVGGTEFPVVWSILGGAVFVGAIGLLSRGGRNDR